jgi:DNA-binding SARP family transcriptional activator
MLAVIPKPVSVGRAVRFCVLGLLEVIDGGKPVSVPRGKERVLLGVLLANANESLTSERLIEALWQGLPPAKRQRPCT